MVASEESKSYDFNTGSAKNQIITKLLTGKIHFKHFWDFSRQKTYIDLKLKTLIKITALFP